MISEEVQEAIGPDLEPLRFSPEVEECLAAIKAEVERIYLAEIERLTGENKTLQERLTLFGTENARLYGKLEVATREIETVTQLLAAAHKRSV